MGDRLGGFVWKIQIFIKITGFLKMYILSTGSMSMYRDVNLCTCTDLLTFTGVTLFIVHICLHMYYNNVFNVCSMSQIWYVRTMNQRRCDADTRYVNLLTCRKITENWKQCFPIWSKNFSMENHQKLLKHRYPGYNDGPGHDVEWCILYLLI